MLSNIFNSIVDHRVTGRCIYSLSDLLNIALLTYICNGEDYVDMSVFAATRAREFGLLQNCSSSPSPDTFERLMSAVDPKEIERCLIESGKQFLSSLAEKQIVIDGKKLRGTNPTARGTDGDYVLNAFVSENHMLIGQLAIKNKENEIPAYPEMLDKLDIEDAVVSIDAMGTQVAVVEKILQKKAHYFLAAKDNQKYLHEAIIQAFKYNKPIDESTEMESDHGRVETRRCRILPAQTIRDEEVISKWSALTTIVELRSEVYNKKTKETSTTFRYYISDEDFPKAAYYNMLARGHWSIENLLHWHLDVNFMEDAARARKGFATQNLSLIRKMALQIVRNYNDKKSIKKRLFYASLDSTYMLQLVQNYKF